MQALIAQVDLARIDVVDADAGKPGAKPAAPVALPAALLADVREQTARADREITDGYERQAVITAAAYLLEHAGLGAESDALLKANLAKSHSPYYLMSELASNAKKRGDKAEALRWYREAFEKSEGPATRLQWGASYVNALVDLAPADEAAIEAATAQLWSEAATQPDAFYERSARSLQKVGAKLQAWNKGGAHRAVDGPAARQARHPVRRADAQRERALDLPGAAQRAGQADRLIGARDAAARARCATSVRPDRRRERAARDRAPDGALRRDRRRRRRVADDRRRREVRPRRRVGLGQVDHRAVGARPRRRREHVGADRLRRQRPARASASRRCAPSAAARSR